MTAARPDAPAHREGTLPSGQYWQGWTADATAGAVAGAVVLVHGLHEHGGRYGWVAGRLATGGYGSYAVDHPGHGRSPGTRGDLGSMAATVEGVAQLVRLAADRHPGLPVFVYGHSMGGLVSLQYLTGTPDARVAGAVLSAPALDTSAASDLQLRIAPVLARLLPTLGVLALDAGTISRDPQVVADYRADPLVHGGRVRARTGAEMMLAVAAMPERLPGLTLPLLVLHGGADRLVPPAASELVPARAGSADVTRTVYDGLFHEPHNEPEKDDVLTDVLGWLDAHRG